MRCVFQKDDFAYSVIDETEISQEFDCSIRHALVECFPTDKEAFFRCSWWHSRPSWRILVHTTKNELVGHIAIVERDVSVGQYRNVVHTAGIQSVFVMPAQRGKGISNRLLILAVEEAARRGLDSGILFCISELAKVYARTG